ncbi:MAG: hypothetical protein HY055_13675 [Magnetospirillum sp.]|nr:hypothetical protein [Magnetospirillum sp.]MBI3707997.1 hypothetical protein [Pseudomonadota bacterium]
MRAFLYGTRGRPSLRRIRVSPFMTACGARPLARLLLSAMVALAFAFQGLLPGLDLALRGESVPGALGLKTAICHSPSQAGSASAANPSAAGGEEQSDSHGCCLVCQVASLAKGALPSPTFTLPTAGTAELRIAARASTHIDGQASHHQFARGPPLA